jgi:AraC family transcriptional activator of pyochelin receptor
VGLNRRKLTYGFSKLFGQTIFEFGQQIRMDRAVKMLREDRLNIGQIAGLLGYENPRNFSVAFVNRFGVLPKDARARLRMGGDIGATLAGEIDMTCGNRDFS